VFSPDGASIYFVGAATVEDYSGFGIWRIGVDGSGLTKVASANYFFTTPAVSPEGMRIAFFHNAGLYIHSLATGDSTLLGPRGWFPDFSPDGKSIVYHDDDGSVRIIGASSLDIGVFPTPGSRVSWMPDGRWLLTRMADGPVLLNSINFRVVPLPSLWRVRDMTVNR
jgi:Tol biopolymer transport system component